MPHFKTSIYLVLGVLGIFGTLPCGGQDPRISVPLEYTSGLRAGGTPTRFAASVRMSGLWRFATGAVAVGPAAGVLYDGSDWTIAGGGRATARVMGMRDAGAFVVVEALHGRAHTPLSLGVIADLPMPQALFARFGVWVTRDVDRRATTVSLLFGTDLARWAVRLFAKPEPHIVNVQRIAGGAP